jgi:hypothetical protein
LSRTGKEHPEECKEHTKCPGHKHS